MVLFESARVLVFHESRNPWASWIPRCVQSIRRLGRIVDWTADGITWEADPRHAELIRKLFGVTGRSVTTPGVRYKLDDTEWEVPIDEEAADRYRANTMRAQYLSSDRLIYRSSAVIWHARCNSRRTSTKWD